MASFVIAAGAVAAGAYGAKLGLEAWTRRQATRGNVGPAGASAAEATARDGPRSAGASSQSYHAGASAFSDSVRRHSMQGFQRRMDSYEARQILALEGAITRDKIRAAHRELMMANHPDHGGSSLLSSKINEAKELLTQEAGDRGT